MILKRTEKGAREEQLRMFACKEMNKFRNDSSIKTVLKTTASASNVVNFGMKAFKYNFH